jgi:hypothetical protein
LCVLIWGCERDDVGGQVAIFLREDPLPIADAGSLHGPAVIRCQTPYGYMHLIRRLAAVPARAVIRLQENLPCLTLGFSLIVQGIKRSSESNQDARR